MNTHKKIVLSLALLTLPLIEGCSHNNNSTKPTSSTINSETHSNQEVKIAKKISKIEAEIYTELKKLDGTFYRSILGSATSDKEIANYAKVNLLSVKIINDTYDSKIKLFYDKSLSQVAVIENFLDPVYSTAYKIAIEHKMSSPLVEIYINDKLL